MIWLSTDMPSVDFSSGYLKLRIPSPPHSSSKELNVKIVNQQVVDLLLTYFELP